MYSNNNDYVNAVKRSKSSKSKTSDKLISYIISDSTCRTVKNRGISTHIDKSQEEVFMTIHPNAEADEIKHYSKYQLQKNLPDNMIIVAGLNDVLHHPSMGRDRDEDEEMDYAKIAEKVGNIGIQAKQAGVGRVCISMLIKPKFEKGRFAVDRVNSHLRQICRNNNFTTIEQSNITRQDLHDAIHVNWEGGTDKLKRNILSELYTYKPNERESRREGYYGR